MNKKLSAYIKLLAAAVMWSSIFLYLKELEIAGLKPVNIITGRMVFASILIVFIILSMKVKMPAVKEIPLLLIPGICFFLGTVLIASGEIKETPDITAVIGFSIPILLSLFLLKKTGVKLNVLGYIFLTVSLIGLVLSGLGDPIIFDEYLLFAFLGAFFVGVFLLIQKLLVKKHGPYVATAFSMWGGIPLAIWFIPSLVSQLSTASLDVWLLLIAATLFSTLIPAFLYINAMQELGPAEGTAVNLMVPFLGSLLSLIFAGYGISGLSWIGGVLTTVGVIIYVTKGLIKEEEEKKEEEKPAST